MAAKITPNRDGQSVNTLSRAAIGCTTKDSIGPMIEGQSHESKERLQSKKRDHHLSKISATGYKGVVYDPSCPLKPYQAQIRAQRKKKTLGRYETKHEAADAFAEEYERLHPATPATIVPRAIHVPLTLISLPATGPPMPSQSGSNVLILKPNFGDNATVSSHCSSTPSKINSDTALQENMIPLEYILLEELIECLQCPSPRSCDTTPSQAEQQVKNMLWVDDVCDWDWGPLPTKRKSYCDTACCQ